MRQTKAELTAFIPQSDHQWEMRERLIKAHGKVQQMHHEEWCQIIDFISIFAQLGLQIAINEAFETKPPKVEFDKIKLELDYNGFKYPTIEDKEKIRHRFDQLRALRNKHDKTLYRIQSKHQVTGLDIIAYKFGEVDGENQIIYAPGSDEESELPLIESDLDILNEWKDHLANAWKSGLDGYQIYCWDNEEKDAHPCKPCSMAEFNAYLATCKWVEPWIRDGFPSINMGRTTDLIGWGKVQSFTAIPAHLPVNSIHL